ncbi:Acyl CoA binding protein [compost metagenome]|jgi:diazepam-binding inhibitor (GABA receptor modulating acyl-CoA-binding protein)
MTTDGSANPVLQKAKDSLRDLKTRPNDTERANLWKLYKQAKFGDYSLSSVGNYDPAHYHDGDESIKQAGWADLKGMSKHDATKQYLDLAAEILKKYS